MRAYSPVSATPQMRRDRGFTYLLALFTVAIGTAALAATTQIWSFMQQRERELELLFIGGEFRNAIGLYYQRTPGAAKRYPADLTALLKDERYPTTQRYLRKIYVDPMTGKNEWGLVRAPEGGIMGIHSLSERAPIKTAGFKLVDRALSSKAQYKEWQFTFLPAQAATAQPKPAPAGAQSPNPAATPIPPSPSTSGPGVTRR